MNSDHDKYLKTRVPPELFEELQARAGTAGQRLNTYVREALMRDAEAITAAAALARVEAALAASAGGAAPAQPVGLDHDTRRLLVEVRLLLRELAMQTNAQILARVSAQLAAQIAEPNV